MNLRKAAKAALTLLPRGDYSQWSVKPEAVRIAEDLRSALAEPDELEEAKRLLEWANQYERASQYGSDLSDQIDAFLKRTDSE